MPELEVDVASPLPTPSTPSPLLTPTTEPLPSEQMPAPAAVPPSPEHVACRTSCPDEFEFGHLGYMLKVCIILSFITLAYPNNCRGSNCPLLWTLELQ